MYTNGTNNRLGRVTGGSRRPPSQTARADQPELRARANQLQTQARGLGNSIRRSGYGGPRESNSFIAGTAGHNYAQLGSLNTNRPKPLNPQTNHFNNRFTVPREEQSQEYSELSQYELKDKHAEALRLTNKSLFEIMINGSDRRGVFNDDTIAQFMDKLAENYGDRKLSNGRYTGETGKIQEEIKKLGFNGNENLLLTRELLHTVADHLHGEVATIGNLDNGTAIENEDKHLAVREFIKERRDIAIYYGTDVGNVTDDMTMHGIFDQIASIYGDRKNADGTYTGETGILQNEFIDYQQYDSNGAPLPMETDALNAIIAHTHARMDPQNASLIMNIAHIEIGSDLLDMAIADLSRRRDVDHLFHSGEDEATIEQEMLQLMEAQHYGRMENATLAHLINPDSGISLDQRMQDLELNRQIDLARFNGDREKERELRVEQAHLYHEVDPNLDLDLLLERAEIFSRFGDKEARYDEESAIKFMEDFRDIHKRLGTGVVDPFLIISGTNLDPESNIDPRELDLQRRMDEAILNEDHAGMHDLRIEQAHLHHENNPNLPLNLLIREAELDTQIQQAVLSGASQEEIRELRQSLYDNRQELNNHVDPGSTVKQRQALEQEISNLEAELNLAIQLGNHSEISRLSLEVAGARDRLDSMRFTG